MTIGLFVILGVGTIAMIALLTCYICVFRELCCQPPPSSKRGRVDSNLGQDDLQMGDTTQNVEISIATATETEPSKT
ncbi:hypothetical protein O3M35_010234 [Rhynocoris fuscipes]|uniref:Uncharacterized protein n=1 Tax=Rhynocoris fuscipes TaxID=488301 RepID=A0AAW1CY50_9HEMI